MRKSAEICLTLYCSSDILTEVEIVNKKVLIQFYNIFFEDKVEFQSYYDRFEQLELLMKT